MTALQDHRLDAQAITAWITCMTAASILASIVFEVGYLKGLHLDTNQVSLSFSDLSIGTLIWLPRVVPYAIVISSTLADDLTGRASSGLSRKSKIIFVAIVGVTMLLIYAALGSQADPFVTLCYFVFFVFAFNILLNSASVVELLPKGVRVLLNTFVPLLCMLYIFAYNSAPKVPAPLTYSTVRLEKGELKGAVLRSYERGYIVYDGTAHFVSRDKVTSIDLTHHTSDLVGIPCRYFNVLCPARHKTQK
ncbi:hypothetical protein AEAC466_19100 [Asticcacaulis sp. AC466]|uniref:hypothetical protein n=1 Tax=Asticcacaulis sp. AC466 TaxID=1282362 RepID=UPI0003C3F692|nr:hypothetical protein [Asticcacaulis sp. AC466]ESQ82027.1 hypothetical protein AEAC466_19100 [Asticcacaulis sp. AC466]